MVRPAVQLKKNQMLHTPADQMKEAQRALLEAQKALLEAQRALLEAQKALS